MYIVYVLYSKSLDRLYIGQTSNIDQRVMRHNMGLVKSTKPYEPWILIYTEKCFSRSNAMIREEELKSQKRRDFIRQNYIPV